MKDNSKVLQCTRCNHIHNEGDRILQVQQKNAAFADMVCPKCRGKSSYVLPDKVIPFSNGTEFMSWIDHNCCRCIHYIPDVTSEEQAKCKLSFAIELSTISSEIGIHAALEIGYNYRGLKPTCQKRQVYASRKPKSTYKLIQLKFNF